MNTREHGTIKRVELGPEDHGILTCFVHIGFKASGQGFGGLALNDMLAPSFVADLCATFGVSKIDELVGKHCWALRCFATWNTPIEGLESMDGRRFTLTAWRRKHFPKTESPLEQKRASLVNEAAHLARRMRENASAIAALDASYVDWERA